MQIYVYVVGGEQEPHSVVILHKSKRYHSMFLISFAMWANANQQVFFREARSLEPLVRMPRIVRIVYFFLSQ